MRDVEQLGCLGGCLWAGIEYAGDPAADGLHGWEMACEGDRAGAQDGQCG